MKKILHHDFDHGAIISGFDVYVKPNKKLPLYILRKINDITRPLHTFQGVVVAVAYTPYWEKV